jgi:hypothetical protein
LLDPIVGGVDVRLKPTPPLDPDAKLFADMLISEVIEPLDNLFFLDVLWTFRVKTNHM